MKEKKNCEQIFILLMILVKHLHSKIQLRPIKPGTIQLRSIKPGTILIVLPFVPI